MNKQTNLKAVDLFAGTGAFSLALEALGVDVVYANDQCKQSKKVYKKNWPEHRFSNEDVMDIQPRGTPKRKRRSEETALLLSGRDVTYEITAHAAALLGECTPRACAVGRPLTRPATLSRRRRTPGRDGDQRGRSPA
jgi:hypothetical protein